MWLIHRLCFPFDFYILFIIKSSFYTTFYNDISNIQFIWLISSLYAKPCYRSQKGKKQQFRENKYLPKNYLTIIALVAEWFNDPEFPKA